MKRFIGVMIALVTLCSSAFAATASWTDGKEPTYDEATSKVIALYTGLADGQATLLAYKVADNATEVTAYVDEITTPIMGIDQESADGKFEFAIPDTFKGKIAVLVGGTDVSEPVKALVTVGENGITVIWGDVNGDKIVNADDATAIYDYVLGINDAQGGHIVGTPFIGSLKWGDVNADGAVNTGDATAVYDHMLGINSTYGIYTVNKTYNIVADGENNLTVTEVQK